MHKTLIVIFAVLAGGCGGSISYDPRLEPATAPPDYVPVSIERGLLRTDCHVKRFEVREVGAGGDFVAARASGDSKDSWEIRVPPKKIELRSVCKLSYGDGTTKRYSATIDAGVAGAFECTHSRSGPTRPNVDPSLPYSHGYALECAPAVPKPVPDAE